MRRWLALGVGLLTALAVTVPLRQARAAEKGELKLADDDTALRIKLDARGRKHLDVKAGRTVSVPAGPMKVFGYTLFRKDKRGVWGLPSRGAGALANLNVTAEETTTLELGPPLKVKANVSFREVRGKKIGYLSFSIVGSKGEAYANAPQLNGRNVPPAKFKILDENDKEVTSGSFEYG